MNPLYINISNINTLNTNTKNSYSNTSAYIFFNIDLLSMFSIQTFIYGFTSRTAQGGEVSGKETYWRR